MHLRSYFSILVLISFATCLLGQENIYHLNYKNEALYIGAGIGLNVLGTILVKNADDSNLDEVNALVPSDIWAFDRGAISNYSSTAQSASDILLVTGATLPFMTYFSKKCRSEGTAIGVMALKTFLLTNGLTSITKGAAKRYRPYNYNPNVDEAIKLGSQSRLSFFSGHASNSAAMSFFAAKVLTDLHPDMKNKTLVWVTAATIPAAISYLRFEGGKHFPTDLIAGYAVGATIGYFIPSLHLSKNVKLNASGTGALSLKININGRNQCSKYSCSGENEQNFIGK